MNRQTSILPTSPLPWVLHKTKLVHTSLGSIRRTQNLGLQINKGLPYWLLPFSVKGSFVAPGILMPILIIPLQDMVLSWWGNHEVFNWVHFYHDLVSSRCFLKGPPDSPLFVRFCTCGWSCIWNEGDGTFDKWESWLSGLLTGVDVFSWPVNVAADWLQ